jgi:hypothetical protein
MQGTWPAVLGVVAALIVAPIGRAHAEEASGKVLRRIQRQINELQTELQEVQRRDTQKIQVLEGKVKDLEGENATLRSTNKKIEGESAQTTQEVQTLKSKVDTVATPGGFSRSVEGYLGEHRFVMVGSAAGSFVYDRNTNNNTFAVQFEPLFLYQLNDWIAFESEIEAELPDDAEDEFHLESAMAHIFLTDNLEVQIGKWFLPFGDFIEDIHPFWVNKLVDHPLPLREGDGGGLLTFFGQGIQARGAYQWGAEGQDVDYVAFIDNGPAFDEEFLQAPGQPWTVNNRSTFSHSKGYGGRLRVYPLEAGSRWGRVEFGASTFDGKWLNDLWLTSWGIDVAYWNGSFEARGEYIYTHRQLPDQASADNREGWYVQVAYQLSNINLPNVPARWNNYLHNIELIGRYSGQNQRATQEDIIGDVPGPTDSGSPSQYAPHARQVSFGLDYWIAPSIVWKAEFEIQLPQDGGYFLSADDNGNPVYTPATNLPNDRAFLTQFAIGF